MDDIQLKTVALGTTKLENYTAINDNFANMDLGKLDVDGTAVNAEKVNGLTVETAVPANVVFFSQEEKDALATDKEVESATKYTNETPIVTAIGGIKVGETFEGLSVQEMLDKLLYPYVQPVAGISVAPNGGTYEKGSEVAVTSLKVTATKKSRNITKVEAKNGGTSLKVVTEGVENGGTFDCMPEGGLKISTNTTLSGHVTDADNKTVYANSGNFTFVDPFYYGTIEAGVAPDSDAIKAMTKVVQTRGTKTFKYTTNNNCMVIAYPQSYGDLKSALDPNKFENIASYTKSVVNVACLSGEVAYNVYVKVASTAENFAITYSF